MARKKLIMVVIFAVVFFLILIVIFSCVSDLRCPESNWGYVLAARNLVLTAL